MTNEGERPRSSWQSWVRSSATRRSPAPEAPTSATPPPSDLDVELEWSEGAPAAPAPSLDAGLSWEPEATAEVPVATPPPPPPVEEAPADDEAEEADEAVAEVVDDEVEYAPDETFADDAGDDDGEHGELLPAVPLLPSIAGRVEALSGLLRSISMRVDGLTAVTDVYRANVTDRIDEYTETVLQLSRQSDQALDEHRRSSERAIGELRRTASDRGDAVGQLVARVEELATDVATLRELIEVLIDTMPASAEGSGAPLTRGDLDEAVEVIADAVATRTPATVAGPDLDVDALADAVVARIDTSSIVDAVVARMEQAFEVVSEEPAPARPAPAPTTEDLLDAVRTPVAPEPPAPRRRGGRLGREK